jgi:hypothetical protein
MLFVEFVAMRMRYLRWLSLWFVALGFSQILVGDSSPQQGNGFANAIESNERAHPGSGFPTRKILIQGPKPILQRSRTRVPLTHLKYQHLNLVVTGHLRHGGKNLTQILQRLFFFLSCRTN